MNNNILEAQAEEESAGNELKKSSGGLEGRKKPE
jgi:hypothetical protein